MKKDFNFSVDGLIARNVMDKRAETYKSIIRYFSISEEEKKQILSEVGVLAYKSHTKRKHKRL